MAKGPLTPEGFGKARRELRFMHGFAHKDLTRAEQIAGALIGHVERKTGTSSGLRASRYGLAEKLLKKPKSDWGGLLPEEREALSEWRKMSPQKQEAFKATLESNLGIKKEESVEPKPVQKIEEKQKTAAPPSLLTPFFAPKPPPSPPAMPESQMPPPSAANDNEIENREAA